MEGTNNLFFCGLGGGCAGQGVTRSNMSSLGKCVCARAQSCLTLCDPMDCSPPGSSVHGISQARILEWVAISFFRGSSLSRDQTCVSCIGRWILLSLSHQRSPVLLFGLNLLVKMMSLPRATWYVKTLGNDSADVTW